VRALWNFNMKRFDAMLVELPIYSGYMYMLNLSCEKLPAGVPDRSLNFTRRSKRET